MRTTEPSPAIGPATSLPDGAAWKHLPWGFLQTAFEGYVSVEAGTDLVHQGDNCQNVYRIVDGWWMRYKLLPDGRRHIYDLRLPGDLINLPTQPPYRSEYSVRSVTKGRVARFNCGAVLEIFRNRTAKDPSLVEEMINQHRALDRSLLRLGRLSALERMADVLVELADRLGWLGEGDDDCYHFPITQEILADMLALSIVHVNRTLRRLREMELVTINSSRQEMIIHDFEGLRELSQLDDEADFHFASRTASYPS